jgi:predicted RecB family nuclease
MTLFDPTWVTFECVACGCSVYTMVPNPEQRCGICQFISECASEDQDGLRDLLIRGGATNAA